MPLGVMALAGLLAGCGGGGGAADGGTAQNTQKFEKATDPAPGPKGVPVKKSSRDVNDLSPRERRAQEKAAG